MRGQARRTRRRRRRLRRKPRDGTRRAASRTLPVAGPGLPARGPHPPWTSGSPRRGSQARRMGIARLGAGSPSTPMGVKRRKRASFSSRTSGSASMRYRSMWVARARRDIERSFTGARRPSSDPGHAWGRSTAVHGRCLAPIPTAASTDTATDRRGPFRGASGVVMATSIAPRMSASPWATPPARMGPCAPSSVGATRYRRSSASPG